MLNNHLYNLINQLAEEHRSLWRIKKMYKKDSGRCSACRKFWSKMEKDKQEHIEDLLKLIQSHL